MAQVFPAKTPAGYGSVHLTANPPQFATMTYAYPLKLISPSPYTSTSETSVSKIVHKTETSVSKIVHTLFLLSYGGGLVAGDKIDLNIKLDPFTRLVLLTQGSTKIFCTTNPGITTLQHTTVDIGSGAALCYIPDPVQPFADSAFEQRQTYRLAGADASLCICDWVCCGRAARGERWNFWRYGSRNEVYDARNDERPRLLLRDHIILDPDSNVNTTIAAKVEDHGVFGTMFIYGPVFDTLGRFFLEEFEALPRIGAKDWGDEPRKDHANADRRLRRQLECQKDGVLWTAAHVRGFVMIKFAAREVEGARKWLRGMLTDEGSVASTFGERSILCVK